jgi:putative membrane protein
MKSFAWLLRIWVPALLFFFAGHEALADYRPYGNWGWGPGMMGWGMMGWFGPLFMIIFWILVIVLIVLLIRSLLSSNRSRSAGPDAVESALEILKKRYARGEIEKEEFEAKKKDLS